MFENIKWIAENIKGKRDHDKESFNCHIGCVAWPYGKIKIATPLLLD